MTDLPVPKEFEGKFARTIDNFLTEEECKAVIASCEKRGFEQALINMGGGMQMRMTEYRNNDRVIVDSFPVVDVWWQRLEPFMVDVMPRTKRDPGWEAHCINERLRILRYQPGQYFKGHMDGNFCKDETADSPEQVSFVTLHIYLNESMTGGATTFLGTPNVEVVPKTGTALVFEHNIFHEGSKLLDGLKYTVRTDIMYIERPKEEKLMEDRKTRD